MVFALVLLTLIVFIAIDCFLRKEDRQLEAKKRELKSPIFLKPEQSLLPLATVEGRLFHPSHSWMQMTEDGTAVTGFDDFVSWLFPGLIEVVRIPAVGNRVKQGESIWQIAHLQRRVVLRAPISGTIIEINPALKLGIPLPAKDIEKSWVLRMQPDGRGQEFANLIPACLANQVNTLLKDDVVFQIQKEFLLNDGGKPDEEFFENLSDEEWNQIVERYFHSAHPEPLLTR